MGNLALTVVLVVRLLSDPGHPPIEVARFETEAQCRAAMDWNWYTNSHPKSRFRMTCEVAT